ncbi:MAG TPA: carbohydrate porin [Candidatus Acidoferrum sp.]|nr:carbohydrate porin [Candidatus Acidoferrum sp.]
MKTRLVPLVLMAVLSSQFPGEAQTPPATNSATEAIRAEMRQMQQDYERRVQLLEQRLQQLEAATLSANRSASNTMTAGAATNPPPTVAQVYQAFANQQFGRDLESSEFATAPAQGQPLKERVEQILNNYMDIGGYFRAGYGRDEKGGPQPAFQAPGAFAKYRLGNEAEDYGELAFGENWYAPELFSPDAPLRPDGTPSGPIARTQVRLAFYNPYNSSDSSSSFQTSLPEAWAEVGNFSAAQPSLKIWGGNRYYRRQDIYIDDFFFYNMSGAGGGFEDLELPFGKVALAWIGNGTQSGIYSSDIAALPDPNNLAGFSKQSLDLSLYEVPVPWGKAEFAVVGALENSGKDALGQQAPDSSGVAFTAIHTHEHFLSEDGFNKFSLQFGTGAAKTFTSGYETETLTTATVTNGTFIMPDNTSSWRFRVTENFVAQPWENFSVSPAFIYQYTDYHNALGNRQWVSGGVRPIYHFNNYFSLAFEGGADYVKDTGIDRSGTLYKFSLAPQVSLGRQFLSRPVIRAYVTYATWSKSFEGLVGGNDYANDTSGWTWGMQMESWW